MYCIKCGKQISDDAQFCKYCGNPVKVNNGAANRRESNATSDHDNDKEKSRRKRLIQALIIVVILLMVCIVIVLGSLFNKRENNKPSEIFLATVAESEEESVAQSFTENEKEDDETNASSIDILESSNEKSAADETVTVSTVFTPYLYMEGKSPDEIEYDHEESETILDYYTIHTLEREVIIDGNLWFMSYCYFSDVNETYSETIEEGVIVQVAMLPGYDLTEIEAIAMFQGIYGLYDYEDSFTADNVYYQYVSYQWDDVENGDYDLELLFTENNCTVYFYIANEDYGDPLSIIEDVNNSQTQEELLAYFVIDDEESVDSINDFDFFDVNLSATKIMRLNGSYAYKDLTDIVGFSASYVGNHIPDSRYYVIYVKGTVNDAIINEDTYIIVGWYDDGWKIYNYEFLTDYAVN